MEEPTAAKQPALQPWVWIVGILGGVGLVALIVALPTLLTLIPLPNLAALLEPEAPQETALKLPAEFQRDPLQYAKGAPTHAPAPAAEKPPVAQLVRTTPPPAAATTPVTSAVLGELNLLGSLNPFGTRTTETRQAKQEENTAEKASTSTTQTEKTTPNTKWGLVPTDRNLRKTSTALTEGKEDGGTRSEPGTPKAKTLAREGEASQLIKPAVWARPAYPLKTLYRSQTLPGRLLDSINSDIPGQMRIELTVPVFDKFAQDHEILPKGTLVVALQEGKPAYGAARLPLKLEQLELPTGEVISLKATVGDTDGAGSVKVNNHVGKLILATGISALLNIGVHSAAGTPSAGNYFQNPAQAAAGDIGRSIQRDTQSVVDRELRIPPTLTVAAGTACTLNLQENVQFHRKPVIVR